MSEKREPGRIQISPGAIATVASEAAMASYGVVGLATKSPMDGLVELLSRDRTRRGVVVRVQDDQILIDLYIIIQYGCRISEVAHGVMNRVSYVLEQTLSMQVAEVNVHVQGLRLNT